MRCLLLLLLAAVVSAAERPANSAWDIDLPLDGTTVALRVRVPTAPTGPCPVIIFSHGLGGSREGYWPLTEEWASAGFAVIQPTHTGSDTQMLRDAGMLGLGHAARAATRDPALLAGRPRLLSRLIDLLPEIHARLPHWPGTFDVTRIGVGGHSFGAWTTLVVAGVHYRIPNRQEPLSDARPLAFLALSPPGPSPLLGAEAWADATRPMLLMTGSEDRQPGFLDSEDGADHGPAWRERSFLALPPGDKWLAVLTGAHHCAFSNGQGARLSGEPQPEPWMEESLKAITTTWWRAWLSADPTAAAALRSGAAVPPTALARVRWEMR